MSTNARIEYQLTKDKAERMSDEALKAEIERCRKGAQGAPDTRGERHFRSRLSIMLHEHEFRAARKAGIV